MGEKEGSGGWEKSTMSPAPEKKGEDRREEGPAPEDAHKFCGCRFPLLIALLQLLLGVAIAAVAFLMMAISPSLLARETPHWAGITLCVVSLLGFILYGVTYVPDERTSIQFIAKLLYFILCTIGLVLSVLAMAFAGHHCYQTNSFICVEVGEDCVCNKNPVDPIARTFTYAEVSDCGKITETLKLYFLLQIALNLIQALVCAVGTFIMWKHRYQVFFVGSSSTQHWQKV